MAVYTHFGAMGAVVDAVATEGFRRLIAHVDAVGRSDDTIADLRRSAAAYRENALENPHLFGVMFGAISTGRPARPGADPEVALRGLRPDRGADRAGHGRRRAAAPATRARSRRSSGAPCTAT